METLSNSKTIDSTAELDAKTGTITGVFHDKDAAERAYNSLIERGYTRDDISILMSDDTRETNYSDVDEDDRSDLGNKAMEGAGVGSAIGGTAGAILGAIAAIGTAIALPGLGLVIAGPIAAESRQRVRAAIRPVRCIARKPNQVVVPRDLARGLVGLKNLFRLPGGTCGGRRREFGLGCTEQL